MVSRPPPEHRCYLQPVPSANSHLAQLVPIDAGVAGQGLVHKYVDLRKGACFASACCWYKLEMGAQCCVPRAGWFATGWMRARCFCQVSWCAEGSGSTGQSWLEQC